MAPVRKPGKVFAEAVQHHRQGRTRQAGALYREVIRRDPKHGDALFLLGGLCIARGEFDEGVDLLERAVRISPESPAYQANLGEAYRRRGRTAESIQATRRALSLKPDMAEGHFNLGLALQAAGDADEAIAAFEQAAVLKPASAAFHYRALGAACRAQGELRATIAHYERALELEPRAANLHVDLGDVWRDLGMLVESIECYRRAIAIAEDLARAHFRLGDAFLEANRLDEAERCFTRAMSTPVQLADAHWGMGIVRRKSGDVVGAVENYRRAVEVQPTHYEAHSDVVYNSSLHPHLDSAEILAEARAWDLRHAAPLSNEIRPHDNDRTPGRRLRVGYVSPDFRTHVNSHFCIPLFRCHDPEAVEVTCYSDVQRPDSTTHRIRSLVDNWRNIAKVPHAKVADLIRRDRIDVLVDLTMHTRGNRLLVFARKPAPVQVAWLAYPGTTGLRAMDYRFTDVHLDPPEGDVSSAYSEESVRLPETFWCYDPLTESPDPSPLPAKDAGYVTFGCLNDIAKINAGVLELWAGVLRGVERSRLLLHAHVGEARGTIVEKLGSLGIDANRIDFVAQLPRPEYLSQYRRIDVCLDTLPYNGGTTSLDAWWMGVPVVTLVGRTVVGRSGLCLAMNLGLPEIAAHSPEEFVARAVELASDIEALALLRADLRARLRASPLMNAPRFARNIEAAYRGMWRTWCEGGASPG